MESNKQARLSPLSPDGPAADGGRLGADTGASRRFSVTKAELKSSGAAAQFLALGLAWNWDETLVPGVIWAKLCLDLKLTWAVWSALRSHEENSFSSRDGPRGANEEQACFNRDQHLERYTLLLFRSFSTLNNKRFVAKTINCFNS